MMAEFLYQSLVDWFQGQVEKGLLSAGDKMPSLRKISKEQGLSLNTVIHGYDLLVKEGWIEARTKSGYYVCHRGHLRTAVMAAAEAGKELTKNQSLSFEKQHRYNKALQCSAFNLLGQELFSVQLNNMKASHPQGEPSVRAALTALLADLSIQTNPEQLFLANRATSLLAQCIQTLTKPEGKVLLITPCDYRLSQTILALGRTPICLTAGDHGADIDSVENLLKAGDIELLILPSQFAFPVGQELTNLNLRRWYALIETYSVPTIEWDMSSFLPNRPHNTMTLKSLDQAGHILYLGSVEGIHDTASLAWLVMGRYEKRLSGPLKALDLCPGVDQQIALLPLFTQMHKKAFSALARVIWTNAEKVKHQLESLTDGKLSVVLNKGGHSLWIHCNEPISQAMWQTYEAGHLNTLVPGTLLFTDSDADHWFAFNVSMTEQLTDTLQWLQQAWGPITSETTTKADSKTAQDPATQDGDEPVYNPMLDLIQHDFG
ncbi:GntR family transcriptional regulator [Marinomonas agarivorans]|nr:GntR family transcriptional regulator [Marinomonas agarivorans]